MVKESLPGPSRRYVSLLPSASVAETALPTFCPGRVSSFTLSVTSVSVLSKTGLLLPAPVVPRPMGDQSLVPSAFDART